MSEAPGGDAGAAPRPLAGRRVIVTRAADQSDDLAAALRERGAEVIACPVLRAEPAAPAHLTPLRDRLGDYDWLVFTSENGVRGLLAQLAALYLDARAFGEARVACVGTATAAALAAAGLSADFVPSEFRAETLLREFLASHRVSGRRILRVRGGKASTEVEDELRAAGAVVDALDSYRTVPAEPDPAVRADILGRGADAVTFASGSAVAGFERAVAEHGLYRRAVAACIGPVTARAAAYAGWTWVVTAEPSTAAGLAEAVVAGLGGSRRQAP